MSLVAPSRSATGPPHVLIAGAGVAGLEAALALRAFAGERVAITLLEPRRDVVIPADLPAMAFGGRSVPRVPVREAAGWAAAELRPERLAAVDTAKGRARLEWGDTLPYDRLIVATGGRARAHLAGAITLSGREDALAYGQLVGRIAWAGGHGVITRVAIVVPPGAVWPLGAYELALLTDRELRARGRREAAEIALVTSEDAPLGALAPRAGEAVAAALARAGVELRCGSVVRDWAWGRLHLVPDGAVEADRVIALPAMDGPAIAGLPSDRRGFARTSPEGRVAGAPDVWAIGDAGGFPLKHGGIACQQADVAASVIAHELGAPVEPLAFVPVVLARLLDGDGETDLRADVRGGRGEPAAVVAGGDAAFAPGVKIAGRFLAPRLQAALEPRGG